MDKRYNLSSKSYLPEKSLKYGYLKITAAPNQANSITQ